MGDHSITPPPELVEQWRMSAPRARDAGASAERWIVWTAGAWFRNQYQPMIQAAADQELEACCEWFSRCGCPSWAQELRAVRRPKPPSLAEQGLEALLSARGADHPNPVVVLDVTEAIKIRTALERLAELEANQ